MVFFPTLKLFWSIAERNQDRDRRRVLRACRMEPDQEHDVWAGEPLLPETPDDGAIPAEPVGIPRPCQLIFISFLEVRISA